MRDINRNRRINRYASVVFLSSLFTLPLTSAQADLGANLALDSGADGSSKDSGSSFGNAIDGDADSYWQPESSGDERIGVKNIDASFNTVVIRELNGATTSWRLEDYETGEVFASGSTLGSEQVISGFGDQDLYKINLVIESASAAPQIAEFEVYSASGNGESSSSESAAVSSDDAAGAAQCNWYGTLYPLCDNQNDGWGWENSESCIGSTTCSGQPDPYGIVEGDEPETSSSSTASEEGSSSSSESSQTAESSQAAESSASSSEAATSSSSASSADNNPGDVLSCEQANTIQGFAAMGSGTTGGQGGQEITVSTGYEIEQALSDQKDSSTPLTIYVDGTITPDNSDVSKFDIKDMNDVSIIGVGDNALFDGIGIKIWRANNVIVRNITMRYVRIGDKDHITIDGPSSNIWIDHNTFYNSLDVDKDYYDELVSGKGDIDNITVSYNVLRDSWKTSLWGSSDGDSDHRRVTFLGNHWENANSRLPLFRFGEAHVVNNYYDGVNSTGINSRMGAAVRIEGNVFENAHNPIVSYYSSDIGYWDVEDNIFGSNVTWEEDSGDGIVAGPQVESTISYTPPYGYNALPAADTQAHVLANAGAGIATDCLDAPVSGGGDDGSSSSNDDSSNQESSSSVGNSSSGAGDEPGELGSNLALSGGADGSSKGGGTSFGNVNDGDVNSYWQPSGVSGERISVKNINGPFNTVIIRELNNATTAWRLENHETGEVLTSGSTLGSERVISGFGDRNLYKLNLIIESASSAPQIGEFEVYDADGEIDSGSGDSSTSSSSSNSSAAGSSSSAPDWDNGGTVDPSLQGFATVYDYGRDTTTGGDGGEVVTVSNYSDLAAAVSGDQPRVIQISGTISSGGDDMLQVGSHKTIVGLDNNATIDGFGFDISGWGDAERDAMGSTCDAGDENAFTPTQNVIIQNLTFVNSSDDSVNLQCFSHHVWINFNTFHSSNDGSVDIKRGSDLVTVSHNHFIDTDKTMLLGHSANNGDQDRGRLRVTYHHNYFDGTETRQPRVRFGFAHVFNNYYDASNYLLGLGIEATIYAEGNYVERTKTITEPFGSDYHVTWTDSNYYDEATIGRANDSSKTQQDWLDADNSVSPPSYQYSATGASSQPPVAGAGNMP